jgi:hypothetical protein
MYRVEWLQAALDELAATGLVLILRSDKPLPMQATSWNGNYERTLLLKVNRAQGDAGSFCSAVGPYFPN